MIVHQHRAIDKGLRRGRAGLSLTSPSQTLLDLAAHLEEPELEEVFHEAIQRRLTSQSELRRLLARLPGHGAPGTALLSKLLRDSSPDAERQSELERRVFRHFRRHRLPVPECQYKVIVRGRKLGEVDFAWPEARVVVEAEGFRIHSRRQKWSSDLVRYNDMVLEGWLVVRLTWSDVEGEGSPPFERLRQVIRERTRSPGAGSG